MSDEELKELFEKELHEYEEETIENCTVQILTCKKCGDVSVGWWRNE